MPTASTRSRRSRRPAAGAARAAVDRRRRRPRLGAHPERPLRRGAALLASGTSPGHAGRAQVLPPRDDRALPRPAGRGTRVVPARARAQPALLGAVGAHGPEARGVRRLALFFLALALSALVVPGLAHAHPLGNFTINRY